jgi:GNAT superfamily N-acetyltransferase
MEAEDVAAGEEVWQQAFAALRAAHALPEGTPSEADRARMRRRIEHLRQTDPGGSWVAEDDGVVTGLAQSFVRQGLWVLSLLGVAVSEQSRGVGRSLFERALDYGDRGSPGLILSSRDPRAMHRYVAAGFALHPAVAALGPLDRTRLPDAAPLGPEVRLGGSEDLAHVAEFGRRLRGAAHGPDVDFLLAEGAQLFVAELGFALFATGRAVALAATDERTDRALLLAGLASVPDGAAVEVTWISAAQQWAIRACVELGLELHLQGAVMVRGTPGPLVPYLPSGAFG